VQRSWAYLVAAIGCGSLIALHLLNGCTTTAGRSLDVILLTLDTTRADHLGIYGYERPVSPAIDRFAKEAVTFRRFWATAPWTLPAHASLFTGKHPTSHGADQALQADHPPIADQQTFLEAVLPTELGDWEVTLAELLRDRGYSTGAVIGGPYLAPSFGLLQGYEHKDVELPRVPAKRRADELTNRAVAWLKTVPRKRPVHLMVNYFDPHGPYDPPPGFDSLPAAHRPITADDIEVTKTGTLSEDQRAAYVDRYDGEIRFMDHHLGRLLEALRSLGRYEDALIVIVSDHGELFGEHGMMEHGHALYEELLRVPLLVRFPKGRDGGRFEDATVSGVDILPLIAHEAGFPLPPGVEGVPVGRRQSAFSECPRGAFFVYRYGARFDRNLQSVVKWPWKLIFSDRGAPEVYRLDEDPGEGTNRAGATAEAELVGELQAQRRSLRPPDQVRRPARLSPEAVERLRALGYVQ
jgi:arylsulfatase A-like enzyme